MANYILLGGGSLAREIFDWFEPQLTAVGDKVVGYLDDDAEPMRAFGNKLPQLGPASGYRPDSSHQLIIAIASPVQKDAIVTPLANAGATFASLVHRTAWVSASARLGKGVVVAPFGHVSANATVDDYVMINCYSGAGHDVAIGRSTTLSSHVDLTGGVSVGPLSFFGSGASVLPSIAVGARCTIGAGAVVVRPVPDGVTIYSVPGRRL